MPTLHVRSVPEDLYQRLQDLAQEKNRSLSAQVIRLLYHAVQDEEYRQQQGELIRTIRRRRFVPPKQHKNSTDLLREDRSR